MHLLLLQHPVSDEHAAGVRNYKAHRIGARVGEGTRPSHVLAEDLREAPFLARIVVGWEAGIIGMVLLRAVAFELVAGRWARDGVVCGAS